MAVDKLVDSAQLNSDLTSVANAIRAKSGGSGSLSFPSGFISEIGNIPSGGGGGGGGGSVSEDALNFFDADGNIVESYSKAEALALESLPENPTKTGLVPQGWNWTLAEIKDYYTSCPDGIINVGQMYTTDDGKTRIYIHLEEEKKSPIIGISVYGTVDVDWGDGTSHDTLTGTSLYSSLWTPVHNYVHGGDYVIKLTVTAGAIGFTGSSSNNSYSPILRESSTTNGINNYYNQCITRVEIGNGVSKLGTSTFYFCSNISFISISNSVQDAIGSYAFAYCSSIKYISLPRSVSSIQSMGFQYASVSTISLPCNISVINNNAFENCRFLKNITLPIVLTKIDTYTFSECRSIEHVGIPNNITIIDSNAFYNCSSLKNVDIPSGVESIKASAFAYCSSIESVIIPNSVTTIGNSAFIYCTSLKSIVMPSNVATLGTQVFANCFSLKSAIVKSQTISTSEFSTDYVLTSVDIQNGVTSIEGSAFSYCRSILKFIIPSSVTSISANAFSNCSGVIEYHFLSTTPPSLANTSAFSAINSACVMYVPVGSLEAYQTAANWSTYASYMQEESQ